MTGEEAAKVIGTVTESLKSQPLALALVVVNVLFLGGGIWFLHELSALSSATRIRQDALILKLTEQVLDCAKR